MWIALLMMALEIKELADLWSKVTMEIWDINRCLLGTSDGKLSDSLHAQERWDKLQAHSAEPLIWNTDVVPSLSPPLPAPRLVTLEMPTPCWKVQISPDFGGSRHSHWASPFSPIHFPLRGDLTQHQGFKYHLYADNSPIYIISTQDLFPELQTHISNCLLDIALECLIDISNVTCQKLSFQSPREIHSYCLSFCSSRPPGAQAQRLKSCLTPLTCYVQLISKPHYLHLQICTDSGPFSHFSCSGLTPIIFHMDSWRERLPNNSYGLPPFPPSVYFQHRMRAIL